MNALVRQPPALHGRAVTACPACGGTESATVGGEVSPYDAFAGGKTFEHPAYSIRCCAACGLYFKSHTLPLEQLGDYYARLEYELFECDGNFPTDRILRDVLSRLPDGSRVLDFGCSTGRILKGLITRLECLGVEINEPAAAIARERGITIITEEDMRAGRQRGFDAILLTDVYEHLPQPVELVALLAGALNPGGLLAIVTGNADAIRTRERIGEFWYFRLVGHFQMMSARHAEWLAARLGLCLAELHQCSHYDIPLRERFYQRVQSFAYHQFKTSPRGLLSALLRLAPVVNRARRWPNAPALSCTADHFVAVFRKS